MPGRVPQTPFISQGNQQTRLFFSNIDSNRGLILDFSKDSSGGGCRTSI